MFLGETEQKQNKKYSNEKQFADTSMTSARYCKALPGKQDLAYFDCTAIFMCVWARARGHCVNAYLYHLQTTYVCGSIMLISGFYQRKQNFFTFS